MSCTVSGSSRRELLVGEADAVPSPGASCSRSRAGPSTGFEAALLQQGVEDPAVLVLVGAVPGDLGGEVALARRARARRSGRSPSRPATPRWPRWSRRAGRTRRCRGSPGTGSWPRASLTPPAGLQHVRRERVKCGVRRLATAVSDDSAERRTDGDGPGRVTARAAGALCSVTAVAGKTPEPPPRPQNFPGPPRGYASPARSRASVPARSAAIRSSRVKPGGGEGEGGDAGRRVRLHPVGDALHRAEQRRLSRSARAGRRPRRPPCRRPGTCPGSRRPPSRSPCAGRAGCRSSACGCPCRRRTARCTGGTCRRAPARPVVAEGERQRSGRRRSRPGSCPAFSRPARRCLIAVSSRCSADGKISSAPSAISPVCSRFFGPIAAM